MICFRTKKFLRFYLLLQSGVVSFAEDEWRRSKAMEIWDLSVGLLRDIPSHCNFAEKSGSLTVWRVVHYLIDSSVKEHMRAVVADENSGRLCWNWTKLSLEVWILIGHVLSSTFCATVNGYTGGDVKYINPTAEILCEG